MSKKHGAQPGNKNGMAHGERTKTHTSPEYRSWRKMRERCLNPNHHAYEKYGSLGVCERWGKYENFLSDMGRKPSPSHTLDRVDNDKGYSPENCRWASKKEQGRNRRTNKLLEFSGKRLSIAGWADELGMSRNALYLRIAGGMAPEKALTMPVQKRTRREPN